MKKKVLKMFKHREKQIKYVPRASCFYIIIIYSKTCLQRNCLDLTNVYVIKNFPIHIG